MEEEKIILETMGAGNAIKTILSATAKTSGIDEGMTQEDFRHKQLLMLAYIAELLEELFHLSKK